MDTLTISRKHTLLERAAMYHHTSIFLPETKDYVRGFRHEPSGFKQYDHHIEPVVRPDDLYDLPDSAWLTVNHYNALVLNTSNMLIADIDFGDGRLDRHAGATDYMDVCRNLGELHLLDKELYPYQIDNDDVIFADQSYRIYLTHSGCRVICTSIAMPWEQMPWIAQRFMRFLRSDPDYIKLCDIQKCYRARLTPKPWRDKSGSSCVCELVSTEGVARGKVARELKEQLTLHDEMTLAENEWTRLA